VLRRRRPDLVRPFRLPGYPWVPAFFLAVTLALTVAVVSTETRIAALSALGIASGYPVYLAIGRIDRPRDRRSGPRPLV
jgi:amino acid transporter